MPDGGPQAHLADVHEQAPLTEEAALHSDSDWKRIAKGEAKIIQGGVRAVS